MEKMLALAKEDDDLLAPLRGAVLRHPEIAPERYYAQVATDPYFQALSYLRHHIRAVSDAYFSQIIKAKNVDLFLMTSSVSSPSGPGSDSVPIPLMFGGLDTYLVDSSQFGFEPILVGGIPRAYCYLASMRGEEPDARHLNQFYHCEYEAQERLEEAQNVAEGYVKALAALFRTMKNTREGLSHDAPATDRAIDALLSAGPFRRVTFDEAERILAEHGVKNAIRASEHGKDLTAYGEQQLLKILETNVPVWVTQYHRDRVPFYQKPSSANSDRVLNADLLFPPLTHGGFGGEVVGMGQRQDSVDELYESLKRQGIDPAPYEWYIDLRRMPQYKVTSGFGLGIERFISWALGFDSIHKAIIYPRIKGIPIVP